jgi:cyclomaltodextrinase / maltogenic alpha-amylase / neopullulanase
MAFWHDDAIFYHIYPMAYSNPSGDGLEKVSALLPHARDLGCNALYLGPVFSSRSHGYDTTDYARVDPRLGDNAALARLSERAHALGLRLVLDGVFNHTARDFFAFRDLVQRHEASAYARWYRGLSFPYPGGSGEDFSHEAWGGHRELPRLDGANPEVIEYLVARATGWIDEFGIDGIRLDAADQLDANFLSALSKACKAKRPDFLLLAELIHGDYRARTQGAGIDSATNYEAWKGLWSSHNDGNYFEIAYTLKREFGPGGIYAGLPLYAFADNHDVDRVASLLKDGADLYPLYCILFTMPGMPSVYYGSEWGLQAKKPQGTDEPLRPALSLEARRGAPHPDLEAAISRLAALRSRLEPLRRGGYRELEVAPRLLVFERASPAGRVIVAVNAEAKRATASFATEGASLLVDELNPGFEARPRGGRFEIDLDPKWARVLRVA